MATREQSGLLTYQGAAGEKTLVYPVTKMDCVDGLQEALEGLGQGGAAGVSVAFTAAGWSGGKLSIAQAQHQRQGAAFGFTLWHLSGGAYLPKSWAVLQTDLRYDAATGSVTLTAPEAYAGKIDFFG